MGLYWATHKPWRGFPAAAVFECAPALLDAQCRPPCGELSIALRAISGGVSFDGLLITSFGVSLLRSGCSIRRSNLDDPGHAGSGDNFEAMWPFVDSASWGLGPYFWGAQIGCHPHDWRRCGKYVFSTISMRDAAFTIGLSRAGLIASFPGGLGRGLGALAPRPLGRFPCSPNLRSLGGASLFKSFCAHIDNKFRLHPWGAHRRGNFQSVRHILAFRPLQPKRRLAALTGFARCAPDPP